MIGPTAEAISYSDGFRAFARWWAPETPRGAVLYLHGIQSHGGWFKESAGFLATRGFAVLLPDRRGSGRNQVDRGHASSARRLVRDVLEAADWVHQRTGLNRLHVVGVSWGGKLALAGYEILRSRVIGLSLVAPGLFPQLDLTRREKARVAWSLLADPRRLFAIPLDDPSLFTSQPQRQAFIAGDELALRRATASFMWASARLDRARRRIGRLPPVPLAVFLAGHDRIIDNAATRKWLRSLDRWPDRKLFEYADAAHTLEFEPTNKQYIADLANWIVNADELNI